MKTNSLKTVTLKKSNISDFAAERNLLLKSAKSEWVFFVDSDEVVTKKLETEINNLDLKNTEYSGFYITRRNFFIGQYVGSDKIIRLGRKNAGRWRRAVHETWDLKGKVGELKNPLIHNTASKLSDYISKVDRYSTLHAKANQDEGKIPTLFKIVFYPILKFIITFIKSKNVVFSIMQSFHSFLSWSKQYLSFYS